MDEVRADPGAFECACIRDHRVPTAEGASRLAARLEVGVNHGGSKDEPVGVDVRWFGAGRRNGTDGVPVVCRLGRRPRRIGHSAGFVRGCFRRGAAPFVSCRADAAPSVRHARFSLLPAFTERPAELKIPVCRRCSSTVEHGFRKAGVVSSNLTIGCCSSSCQASRIGGRQRRRVPSPPRRVSRRSCVSCLAHYRILTTGREPSGVCWRS